MFEAKYSIDELLRDKPTKLKEITFQEYEGDVFINVNGVTVFARDYEMIYGEELVMIKFWDGDHLVACISEYGSNDIANSGLFFIKNAAIVSQSGDKK